MILPNKSILYHTAYYYKDFYEEWDGKGLDDPMTNFCDRAICF